MNVAIISSGVCFFSLSFMTLKSSTLYGGVFCERLILASREHRTPFNTSWNFHSSFLCSILACAITKNSAGVNLLNCAGVSPQSPNASFPLASS